MALDAERPRITFATCDARFNDHLHESGQRSYTVKELEAFIDHLAATQDASRMELG